MQNEPRPQAPAITVLFPTYGRPERAEALLRRLGLQTLAPEQFEVIVVDDGSQPPIQIDVAGLPYSCKLVHQSNAGPAAARNTGLALTAAPLVLILNDDAVPADDLLERHIAAHGEVGPKSAVLGTFHFTEEARTSAFTRALDESDLLFTFSGLKHGARLNWTYFWTCNISLPTEALVAVGGFDEENFDRAMCEDVELGLRLENKGWNVVFREDCVAHHEHIVSAADYMRRAFDLGIYRSRFGMKVGNPGALFPEGLVTHDGLPSEFVTYMEDFRVPAAQALEELEAFELEYHGREIPEREHEQVVAKAMKHSQFFWLAGLYFDKTGIDAREVMEASAQAGTSISIIAVSCNALENTKRCIEALRAASDERYPQQIIVVDNGSTDGSVEWLGEQSDIDLIRNPFNHGAPRARNQAIGRATGDWVVFMDNDVFVPQGWLDRALYHGAVDAQVGSIALCANRASKRQVVEYAGSGEADSVQRFADDHFAAAPRSGEDSTLFTSLGVMVRADVLARIGGFDETFSPWGFEDDDLALRIRLAGWRNRVARDTFVYHAPYEGLDKHHRHATWLEQNWRAFLQKWSPSAMGAQLFDYTKVVLPQLGQATEAQLVYELPAAGAPVPTWPGCGPRTEDPTEDPTEVVTETREIIPVRSGERASVVVLGCGRSGTSMVTGLLADAGWYVGEAPYSGREANPKGFFETAEINGINEFLLATAVTDEAPLQRMQHWLALAPEALDLDVDSALRARMDRLGEHGPYAYKDPRFCYTLDAWRPSLEGAKYVCIFREPAVCAASILKECETAEYLADIDMEFERAVDVWDAMYRRVLDDHSESGDWLFVHFDEVLTAEGIARIEEFVGGPVAADFPDARLSRSKSERQVPAAVAATYAELCKRAGHDAAPIAHALPLPVVTEVAAPEMTVLICTYNRLETLQRCLASFEKQTAAGRYEIVVVNDGSTDGTREWLDDRTPGAPTRIVHQDNGGLSAARNAGLEVARGTYVMLINDDTIAFPDLVEEHLAAHAEHGPDRAILGTFEQPRAALDNALMRVLEATHMVFCYAGLDPSRLHDWTRFWTCNVSVSRQAIDDVGRFDETFRHYGCEDTDLAYRLEKERGVRVVYHPAARAHHEHLLTFEDLRKRSRTVSAAFVRFFRKHPEALTHEHWRGRATHTLAGHESLVVQTLPDRARAEAFANELSWIDVGALERTGPEGDEIARATLLRLEQYLTELNHIWWSEGESDAFRSFGITGMVELMGQRTTGVRRPAAVA